MWHSKEGGRGGWSRQGHQITQGEGRGLTKVSRDIILNYFWKKIHYSTLKAIKKYIFWKIENVTSRASVTSPNDTWGRGYAKNMSRIIWMAPIYIQCQFNLKKPSDSVFTKWYDTHIWGIDVNKERRSVKKSRIEYVENLKKINSYPF